MISRSVRRDHSERRGTPGQNLFACAGEGTAASRDRMSSGMIVDKCKWTCIVCGWAGG